MIEQEVEIYGKRYVLRGANAEEIRAIAVCVDRRARELFGQEPKPLDPGRMFVLALNFAEELCNLQREDQSQDEEFGKRLQNALDKVSQLEKFLKV
jgi:cell division protein ZapA (FtsZ GTPase activity inhibitor)